VSCDVNGDGSVNAEDVQAAENMALGIAVCTPAADLNTNGFCDFGDVIRVINADLGEACIVGPGRSPAAPTGLTATSTQTTASLSWTASTSSGIAGYEITGVSPVNDETTTSYTATNLSPATNYSFDVYAYDSDGDISAPQAVSILTAGIAPAISSFAAAPNSIVAGQSSTLSWSVTGTPIPSLSIDHGVGVVSTQSLQVSPASTTTYTLTATNSAGSVSATATVTVTADTTPPSVPTALIASPVSASQINLSWTASTDNVAVTGYRVYRNGSQIGISTSTAYSDTGLAPATSYSYTVSAYDAAGNVSAPSTAQSATTLQAAQTITFGALANEAFGSAVFLNAAASSGLSVSFTSQTPGVCTVSGATVTWVSLGACTIQATQPGNTSWTAATPVNQSFQVTQGSQTIIFGALSNQALGTASFTVRATASSGLTVSFASTTPAVCTVPGTTVALLAVGTCTIQATQAGNSNYAAATPVNQSFQVTQGSQTITFGAISNEAFGTAPFTLSATSTSGLTVSFASTTAAVCTVAGATVTLATVGTCTIEATQGGNTNWAAATPVTQSFQVTPGIQTINFGTLSNQPFSTFFGTSPFAVNAAASSGLPVSFSSITPLVCTLSVTTVTLVNFGTCSIQATQAGNNNWAAATPVTQSFHVIRTLCDVTQDVSPGVDDVQVIISEALGMTTAVDDLNKDGVVNATDIQILINAVLGLGCSAN
jgi:chitodextrinase